MPLPAASVGDAFESVDCRAFGVDLDVGVEVAVPEPVPGYVGLVGAMLVRGQIR
jgi:hypothetical protein